jgi:AbrB family looped-hinge helix DNA binding protein
VIRLKYILKVDSKGRITIPKEIRSLLDIKDFVSARVEEGKLIIEPIKDPINILTSSVIRGTIDVEKEIRELREIAFKEVKKIH